MGIFGSSTKIRCFSTSSKLIEPNPDALKNSILQAVLIGDSLSNIAINNSLNGMSTKVDHLRSYATDYYTLGLPTGISNETLVFDDSTIAGVIAEDLNLPYGVLIDVNMVMPLSIEYIVLPFLLKTRSINIRTSEIFVYPEGMVLPDKYGNWFLSHTVTLDSIILDDDNVTIQVTYKIVSAYITDDGIQYIQDQFFSEYRTINSAFHLGKNYCIVSYQTLDVEGSPSGITDWWYYDIESGKYPALNIVFDSEGIANMLPVIPVRYNNQYISDIDPDLYISGKKLLKKINVDVDQIVDTLNTNPDIAEIDHAYIMFGIDLQTTDNNDLIYLTEFFDYLADYSTISVWDSLFSLINQTKTPSNSFHFNGAILSTPTEYESMTIDENGLTTTVINNTTAFSLNEYGLNTSITYQSINSKILKGSVGDIGTVSVTKVAGDMVWNNLLSSNRTFIDNSTITFKYQITTNTYKQVTVKGLIHHNYIYGSYGVTTPLANVISNPDEHNFIIPIHYGVAQNLKLLQRNLLYESSLIIVINGVKETKVKWYESTIFTAVLFIVTIVLIIVSGQTWVGKLVAAAKLGLQAVILFALKSLIIAVGLNMALKVIAKWVGPEFMAILSTAIAIYTLWYNPAGAMNLIVTSMPTAEFLLTLSSSLMTAAQGQISRELEDISRQYTDFLVDSEGKTAKLEEAQKLLESPYLLDFDLLDTQSNRYVPHLNGVSPSVLYDLTIHTGNIGTLVLDVIGSYHDIALKLPETNNYTFGNELSTV